MKTGNNFLSRLWAVLWLPALFFCSLKFATLPVFEDFLLPIIRKLPPDTEPVIVESLGCLAIMLIWLVPLGLSLCFLKLRHRRLGSALALHPLGGISVFWFILLAISVGLFIGGITCLLMQYGLYPEPEWETIDVLEMMSSNFIGAMIITLVGPICEEVIFRGTIQKRLMDYGMNKWVVLVLQALLFSAWHMNMYQIPYTFVMGLVLGLMFMWSRTLWVPIILHVVNNFLSVIFIDEIFNYKEAPMLKFAIPAVLGIILSIILLKYLHKRYTAEPLPKDEEAPQN